MQIQIPEAAMNVAMMNPTACSDERGSLTEGA